MRMFALDHPLVSAGIGSLDAFVTTRSAAEHMPLWPSLAPSAACRGNIHIVRQIKITVWRYRTHMDITCCAPTLEAWR